MEPFDLDLNAQRMPKKKSTAIILGFMMSIIAVGYFAMSARTPGFFRVVYLLTGIVMFLNSVLLLMNKNLLDFIGKSYLRLDQGMLFYKPNPYSRKVVQLRLDNIEKIVVHLYNIEFQMKASTPINLDLKNLNDDNLKLVKATFRQIAESRVNKN